MVQRKKVTGHNIGVMFGTFAPFTLGHFYPTTIAKRENDSLLLIASGYTGDRGDLIGLNLQKRFRYIRELFQDDPLVIVDKLDEDNIPQYPNGWEPWLNLLDTLIEKNSTEQNPNITIYVGEEIYVKKINELRPNYSVRYIDRTIIPISATMVRNNPGKHWNYISKPFKRHFTKKVLIMGGASTGKTTLAIDLSKTFNSPWSPEYARAYQEDSNVADEELNGNDYMYLYTGQYSQTSAIIEGDSNNGIIFADSSAMTTRGYELEYLSTKAEEGKNLVTEEQKELLEKLYKTTIAREEWDVIFFVLPKSKYIDDGFRDMNMSNTDDRWDFSDKLISIVKDAGFEDKIIFLGEDSTEDNFFRDNYINAIKYIKEKLSVDIGQQ